MKRVSIVALIVALCIPIIVGILSAMLTVGGMASYATMEKPPLSPPAWVFTVAWAILYIMMGLASYFVYMSEADGYRRTSGLVCYGIQLVMNFMWSIIFFNMGMYLFAFIWLIIMWCLVIICMTKFWAVSRMAGVLMIPYVLWLTFAAYLNIGTYLLSIRGK